MSWRRTLLALLVVDLLIWRSWAQAGTGAAVPTVPAVGTGSPDYLGICTLIAMAVTVVLGLCVLARGRELRRSSEAPAAALLRWTAAAVVVLAGSAAAAMALGR